MGQDFRKASREDIEYRIQYFKGKRRSVATESKIVQIGEKEICLLEGQREIEHYRSLLTHDYDVSRSCLIIDLSYGVVTEKSEMITGRAGFGVGHINNFIYVISGTNSYGRSIERYDIFTDKWLQIPKSPQ